MPVTSIPSSNVGGARYRAEWVLPIDGPPIWDGEVAVEEGRIVSVGPATGRPAYDLKSAALLPGFVNVHAHVEYTILRGMVEDLPFFPWLRSLIILKTLVPPELWVPSAVLGTVEMLAAGITTVADASDAGAALPAFLRCGMRGIVYREVFGIEESPTVEETVALLEAKLAAMREEVRAAEAEDRVRIGISPHAPYTVRPALFRALSEFAARERLPQTIHIAESPAESELIEQGAGPFAEMFARRGIAWKTPAVSPVKYLDACGALGPETLAVHCVHVDRKDAALLKARGASVAHCPKSNGKLAAGFSPLRLLLDAGVPVGLGTDSMVSNNSADMFEEVRFAVYQTRALTGDAKAFTAPEALRLATLGGAEALGMADEIGSLTPGKRADLCAVDLDGKFHLAPATHDSPEAALVYGARASDICLTMVGGKVLYDRGEVFGTEWGPSWAAVSEGRRELQKEWENRIGA